MQFGKSKKIFIVDDDEMLSKALSNYITLEVPHQVKVFQTGEDCLKNMAENPNVVILDYFLNSVSENAVNGMEILKVIKKNYPQTHVIMLSSQEKYSVAMQTVQKGAEQYVIKDKDSFENISRIISEI